MPKSAWMADPAPESARAPVTANLVESSDRCSACGKPLTGRQRLSCSGRCRAALSRKKKAEAQEERDRKIRGLLEEALGILIGEGDRL